MEPDLSYSEEKKRLLYPRIVGYLDLVQYIINVLGIIYGKRTEAQGIVSMIKLIKLSFSKRGHSLACLLSDTNSCLSGRTGGGKECDCASACPGAQ